MERWKSQSNPGRQIAATLVCFGLGLALAVGFHDFAGPGMTNSKAGFFLGLLLLVIGGLGFLVQGRQTVVVDPSARRITIEDKNRIGMKRRSIGFQDIVGVSIGYLGKKSNYVTCYYLVLKLRNGEEYPLFAPGRFYEGASDRSVVEGWKRRLETYMGQ
jgi:hypothetical protein